MVADDACPYCGASLPKLPKANCKCQKCKHVIYVRKQRPFYDKDLLTEEEMLVSDEFVMLNTTQIFQATKELYEQTRGKLSARFGTLASWDDVTWSLYHQYAADFSRQPDFDALSVTYACMAAHMHRRNQSFSSSLSESHRYRLMCLQQLGFKQAAVSAAAYDCPACEALKTKVYRITDELIKHPPLPPESCTCLVDKKLSAGYCICSFIANVK